MFAEKVKTKGFDSYKEVVNNIENKELKARYGSLLFGLLDIVGQEGLSVITMIIKLITTSPNEIQDAVNSIEDDADCVQYLIDVLDDIQLVMLVTYLVQLNKNISKELKNSIFDDFVV